MSARGGARRGRWAASEGRLGMLLVAPAAILLALVAGLPIVHAFRLSFRRADLRFPEDDRWVGLDNYVTVLRSEVWWQAVATTLEIAALSVTIELVLGFALAALMHRAATGAVRAAILVPYGVLTIVGALAWKLALDPAVGFVNPLLGVDVAWLDSRGTALVAIILAEVWKTTPFMALLLLAGMTLVPRDAIAAARVDGASAWQRLLRVRLPLMKPAIGVALLFRTLDAFRIFDSIFVQTRGAHATESVSIVGYETLVSRLNLGLGSAVSVSIFVLGLAIAAALIVALRIPVAAPGEERR